MNADNFLYKELTDRLLASAFKVHNTLGAGFLEKVYENALLHELAKEGIMCEQQKALRVLYDTIVAGEYVADVVIEGKIDALVKSPKSPFDKLRANGGLVEIIDFIPFVVSLSNHRKDFLRLHQS